MKVTLACVLAAALSAASFGTTFTTATVQATNGMNPPCSLTSAGALLSCTTSDGTASADASAMFGSAITHASASTFAGAAGASSFANSAASFNDLIRIMGGSGSGTAVVTFEVTVMNTGASGPIANAAI